MFHELIWMRQEQRARCTLDLHHACIRQRLRPMRHDGNWQFNPTSLQVGQGGDILMVMTTAEGRIRLEQLMQGAG